MIDIKNRIYEIMESMDELFSLLSKEKELCNSSIELINLTIEVFESLNKIELLKNKQLDFQRDNFANELILLINDINEEKQLLNFNERIKSLFNAYQSWKNKVIDISKFKVIVYGLNQNTVLVNEVIDKTKTDVVNYVDTSGLNSGKYFNEKLIISANDIKNTYFDYIILCEDITINCNNISKQNTINFYRYMNYNFDYNFYKKYCEFIKSSENYDGIITGLSYAEVGINTEYLDKKFFNFAVSSQDLFYDYEIVKYILSFDQIKANLKYVIICLAYYSFDYDMSKSSKKIRTNIYYPIFKTMHNWTEKDINIEQYESFSKQINNIFKKNFYIIIYELLKEETEEQLDKVFSKQFIAKRNSIKEMENIVLNIQQTFNKNFPLTQNENITILSNYLNLLKENNIKPIIVVCPESRFSRKYIDKKMESKFLYIIEVLKRKYNFLLLNYFNNIEFEEMDFYDGVHLNYYGSKKLTCMLNKDIKIN